ncbi:MAG: type II toxin-antitoxin system RelE/ParE family toxin [Bacteroidota bacterium]
MNILLVIVLTNGFAKKSQKVPRNEINVAEQRKRDYIWRKDK